MSRTLKIMVVAFSICAVGLSSFIGGYVVSAFTTRGVDMAALADDSSSGSTSELNTMTTDMFKLMQDEALAPPSETSATIGAVNGLVKSNGDKYARYLPPTDFESYSEEMSGSFGGIGVVLGEKNSTSYVVQVYKTTPAAKAGLKTGDYFYGVGDTTSDKWTTEKIQKLVKGKPGTKVKLTMLRPYKKGEMPDIKHPLGKPYTVTITRAVIETPNTIVAMKGDHVGYVRLFQFNRIATKEVRREIESLTKKGATSFILDLRDNPGGDLYEAVGISSLFIKKGPIVKIESRVDGTEVIQATGNVVTDAPLVVLANENSASASEIVSGALQDYKRAPLVGAKTFGKGSVQTQFETKNGGAVLFTTAHYLTPKDRKINDIGLTPDVESKMNPDLQGKDSTDTQLQTAIKKAESLQTK